MNPDSPFPLEVPPDGYAGARPSSELVPWFIPSLAAVLLNAEKQKGSALTREEVLALRDSATCVMIPREIGADADKSRGYLDIHPERCWEEFLELKRSIRESENGQHGAGWLPHANPSQ